jgi:hypothetical protein
MAQLKRESGNFVIVSSADSNQPLAVAAPRAAPRRLSALLQFSRKSLWYENVLENQGVPPSAL